MGRYPEIDLGEVQAQPIRQRDSRVREEMSAEPARQVDSFAEFWDGLPDVLAAAELRALVDAILKARTGGRPVLWMFGAHVIKVGLSPTILRLIREDLVTCIAVNGAFAIHDAELALWGHTSEDVAVELRAGRFGLAAETAELINGAAHEAVEREEGFGEALGRCLADRRDDRVAESVLAAAYRAGIPATVHVAVGTDVVHQHGSFSGRDAGEASARDFRILAAHLRDLSGAVVVNVGSAVVLPEVFLKAFSVVTHLGSSNEGLVTATLDFQKQYRPLRNVVQRPPGSGGRGIYLVGHHEILLPLLLQGLRLEQGRREQAGNSLCSNE